MSLTNADLVTIKEICLDILLRYIFTIWVFAGINFLYVWSFEESSLGWDEHITNYAYNMPFIHSVVALFTSVYFASFKKYRIEEK